MEYEIQDHDVLFDDSTNPSLEQDRHTPGSQRPADKRKVQKAELIPEEEEHQLA